MDDDGRELIGRVFVVEKPVEVTAELIKAFCESIAETGPLHTDAEAARRGPWGRIVAPLSISGSFRASEDIFDHLPPSRRRLLGSMELEFFEPIGVGDRISIASEVADVYEKTGRSGRLTFTVIHTTLTNQHGVIVTRISHRFTTRHPLETRDGAPQ